MVPGILGMVEGMVEDLTGDPSVLGAAEDLLDVLGAAEDLLGVLLDFRFEMGCPGHCWLLTISLDLEALLCSLSFKKLENCVEGCCSTSIVDVFCIRLSLLSRLSFCLVSSCLS